MNGKAQLWWLLIAGSKNKDGHLCNYLDMLSAPAVSS